MNKTPLKIILDEEKIKKSLNIKNVIKIVEEGFRKKGLGLVSLLPKMGPDLRTDGAFADSMPVSVFDSFDEGEGTCPRLQIFGIKWLSAYKSNIKKGLPYINSLIILNDRKTGEPIAILKGNWITAIRTAAVSAVTAKYLAPKKKQLTVGIFGTGLQAYVHVLAFKALYKNPRFILFNHSETSLRQFLVKFKNEKFQIENDFHKVVQNSDVIISATTFTSEITPYIYYKDLKDDVLILPLDYGSRIDPALYKKLDEVYTDDISQYELKSKVRTYFPKQRPIIKIEVGDLIAKRKTRDSKPKKILVFNLGIALFDILTALSTIKK
jgi:ornithine cyclodeaminase/alanine dehydrogenase-like protein (mu-crystallin family)